MAAFWALSGQQRGCPPLERAYQETHTPSGRPKRLLATAGAFVPALLCHLCIWLATAVLKAIMDSQNELKIPFSAFFIPCPPFFLSFFFSFFLSFVLSFFLV